MKKLLKSGCAALWLACLMGCGAASTNPMPQDELLSRFDDAVVRDNAQLLQDCLRNGGDPSICIMPSAGLTLLHQAAALGATNIINALVKAGANKNAWDDLGALPIKYAIEYGHTNAALLLSRRIIMQDAAIKTAEIVESILVRIYAEDLRAGLSNSKIKIGILLNGTTLPPLMAAPIAAHLNVEVVDPVFQTDGSIRVLCMVLKWNNENEAIVHVRKGCVGPSSLYSVAYLFGYWIIMNEKGGEA
jgi:ankyrin repeat protein